MAEPQVSVAESQVRAANSKVRVAVSHCLLGCACRYDGAAKPCETVIRWLRDHDGELEVVPVCPERASGLPVPRPPAEQRGGRVVLASGEDVTEAFERGSTHEAERVLAAGCGLAILKANSPSCGTGVIYDGSFSHRLVPGWGTFAAQLREAGVRCVSEEAVDSLGLLESAGGKR